MFQFKLSLLEPCGFVVRLREWASGYAYIHMILNLLLCTGEWPVSHKLTIWPQWPTESESSQVFLYARRYAAANTPPGALRAMFAWSTIHRAS